MITFAIKNFKMVYLQHCLLMDILAHMIIYKGNVCQLCPKVGSYPLKDLNHKPFGLKCNTLTTMLHQLEKKSLVQEGVLNE